MTPSSRAPRRPADAQRRRTPSAGPLQPGRPPSAERHTWRRCTKRAEPRARRTGRAGKRLLLTGGRPRSCGSGTFPAAPTPLPRSVPPHPASVLRLWSREAGGCGRAGCGHRPDRAEARTRLAPPRERSAGAVAVARIIQPRAQAEEGSGFFLNGSSGIGARHGETRQQQNLSLPVATQPSQPMPYSYSPRKCPIVRRRGSYDL